MIECDYYKNYRGPNLVKAEIWQRNKDKVDITEDIKKLYGENNNWNGMLYLFSDVFPDKDYTTHFKVDFYLKMVKNIGFMEWLVNPINILIHIGLLHIIKHKD